MESGTELAKGLNQLDRKNSRENTVLQKTKHADYKTNTKLSNQTLASTPLPVSKEQLLSCSIISYRYYYQLKSFKAYKIVNIYITDHKSSKVGTIVEFRLLVLDSPQHSNKAKSPINRSAKQSSIRTLLLRHNH